MFQVAKTRTPVDEYDFVQLVTLCPSGKCYVLRACSMHAVAASST